MISERRASVKNEARYDLLSSLLAANEGTFESDAKLTDDALLGVCFIAYYIVPRSLIQTVPHRECFRISGRRI